jgi:hypothetical protein
MHEEAEKLPRRTGGPRERLSEARAKFVRIFARTGLARYAAEQAGYSRPETEAARLRADPNVIKAVLEARESFIVGELGGLAYAELKHLITDRDRTPPSVRFAACRWVLEAAGHGPKGDTLGDQGKALADMSLGELATFIRQGDAVLAGLQQANAIQGTAERLNSEPLQASSPVDRLKVADLLD